MSGDEPLAFVVQRYGPEIVGGLETLCRVMAEILAASRPVEVLTTCARDYITWRNELPAGAAKYGGVVVRRFPVDFQRGPKFHELMGSILGGVTLDAYHERKELVRAAIAASSREDQLECLKLQGPYSTPLLDYLAAHHDRYSRVVFFTYLYPTTIFGARQVPAFKTMLVPAAHDEAQIFFPVFREVFARFPALIFLTPEERAFIEDTFAVAAARKATIGMPVELPAAPDPARFRAAYGIEHPFLLYAGRIDRSKGCEELVRFFLAGQPHLPADLDLVLAGDLAMPLPGHPRVRYLGRLSENDKYDALAAASALVNPSSVESFSIITLEALLCGVPVLVNGRCAVLKGHVTRSRAGLYYAGYGEFCEALRLLLADDALRQRLGRNGREYVRLNYSRHVIERRLSSFLLP